MPGDGAAGRLRHMERLVDDALHVADYWKVRALRAEGHDVPALPHPSQRRSPEPATTEEASPHG